VVVFLSSSSFAGKEENQFSHFRRRSVPRLSRRRLPQNHLKLLGEEDITFRVRIRRKLGGFLSETTISKTKKNVLDEVKHFAQFHQHTTFQEEEEENHGNERRREEEGEHEREAVIAHDLPQSTVDAHLDETEEENRSSGSETTTTTTTTTSGT
jgi:hypothetical protein